MHGAPEGRLRPGADASLRIRRYVGRVHHAKRGCERVATGELLSILGRMTLRTIAAARKGFALGNEIRGEAVCSGQRDRNNGRPPRQHAKAREPETSESDNGDEQLLDHGVLRRLGSFSSSASYAIGPVWLNQNFQRTANRCEAMVIVPSALDVGSAIDRYYRDSRAALFRVDRLRLTGR